MVWLAYYLSHDRQYMLVECLHIYAGYVCGFEGGSVGLSQERRLNDTKTQCVPVYENPSWDDWEPLVLDVWKPFMGWMEVHGHGITINMEAR